MTMRFRKLFEELSREEWRKHSNMFGGRRFEFFPITMFLFVLVGGSGLFLLGINPDILFLGLSGLTFAFGLQTGTIGFISSELMKNELGDFTSLLFSTRVHPVDESKMLLAFIVKDLAFYLLFFVLPVTVAFGISGVFVAKLSLLFIVESVLSGVSFFVLGMGIMVSVTVLGSSRVPNSVPTSLMVLGLYGVYVFTGTLASPLLWVGGVIVGSAALAISVLRFDSSDISAAKEEKPGWSVDFGFLRAVSNGPTFAVAQYTLRNIQRSSGGLLKVPVFGGIVVGVPMLVAALVSEYTTLRMTSFVLVSVISASISLPVYTWLFRSDSDAIYDIQPISESDIFAGKTLAYYVLTLPVFFIVVGSLFWVDVTVVQFVLGLASYVAVLCYMYGVLSVFAGRNPESSLFDSRVYMKVGLSVMALMLPLLVLSFYIGLLPTVPSSVFTIVLAIDGAGAGIGVGLLRYSEW